MGLNEHNVESSMEMIVHAGDAQSKALEAMDRVAEDDFVQAEALIEQSKECIRLAHAVHRSLLQKVSSGENVVPDLILVHAMDHLTMAETLNALARKLLKLFQRENRNG